MGLPNKNLKGVRSPYILSEGNTVNNTWAFERGASPPSISLPLSFQGEGDKGGEVDNLINTATCRVCPTVSIIVPNNLRSR